MMTNREKLERWRDMKRERRNELDTITQAQAECIHMAVMLLCANYDIRNELLSGNAPTTDQDLIAIHQNFPRFYGELQSAFANLGNVPDLAQTLTDFATICFNVAQGTNTLNGNYGDPQNCPCSSPHACNVARKLLS